MRTWIGLGAVIIAVVATASLAQDPPASRPAGDSGTAAGKVSRNFGINLLEGLKATPGCLGVESANTSSGKNVIFAWFKDKKAVLAWYNSEMHNRAKAHFFPDADPKYVPLAGVPDDSGPLLLIASMKLPKGGGDGTPQLPEFSIDTLTPVTAGTTTSPDGGFTPPEFRKIFEARQSERSGK